MLDIQLISICLGLFVGLILALTGAGGSILAIPILMFSLHLNMNQAAPIALLAVMLAATVSTIQGLRKGIVRYKTALLIASFGIAFAPIGVWAAQQLPNQLLRYIFSTVVVYVAWHMWQQAKNVHMPNQNLPDMPCMINKVTSKLYWTALCTKRLVATGVIAGFTAGLLGIGGGFVIVPSLRKVSNFSMQTIIATSLMVIALVSAVSVYSYSLTTPMLWKIALPFVLSTIFGLFIFSHVNHKVPARVSQRGFALLVLLAAVLLVFKT